MLAIDRRVPDNVAELRAGRWNKKEFSKARGLFGRTLGLIGYGNIGAEVARRAQAFGMPVVVWSRRFNATGDGSGAAVPDRRDAAAARRRRGCRERPPGADRRDPGPRRRLGPRADATRLVLHQHRARGSRRRRARSSAPRESAASALGSTFTPESPVRRRPILPTRCSRCRMSTAPTTSAGRPTRRRRRSRPKPSASSRHT